MVASQIIAEEEIRGRRSESDAANDDEDKIQHDPESLDPKQSQSLHAPVS